MEAGGLSDAPAGALAAARWSAPWFAAVAADACAIDWRDPAGALAALNAAARARGIATADGRPLRFVDAAMLETPAYEAHIAATGEVPTRLGGGGFVHDALNALAWLRFPRTKAALNALQSDAIAQDGIGARRGALRDAATLFDESAALLAVAEGDAEAQAALAALRDRDWRDAFVVRRACWGRGIDAVAFGHALMQKLLRPYPAITAHAWAVTVPREWFALDAAGRCAALDARWGGARIDGSPQPAGALAAGLSTRAARTPLPVLGLPGWCVENAVPQYYDDVAVFRPRPGRATA